MIDLNGLLPFFYVLLMEGSKTLMTEGANENYGAINEPILIADVLDFCENLLQTDDVIPSEVDFATFVSDLLLKKKEKKAAVQSESSVNESLSRDLTNFSEQVTREVNDCKMGNVVRSVKFTYSKLAAIIVRFRLLGS